MEGKTEMLYIADFDSQIARIMDSAIKNRRYLHMYPETGFDTHNTEEFVRKCLHDENIEILPSKIGVFGYIPGKNHESIVALRGDMDALCLQEENDVPYRSRNDNKMHACGHDGHTAMLIETAKLLNKNRDSLPYDVLLIFQPAEEGPSLGGARIMLKDLQEKGLADKVKCIFAQHLFNDIPVGKIGYRAGSVASSTDEFYITIIGKGGHAGMPHKTVDAISTGAKVVGALETFMSRRIDPLDQAILSVGIFQGGSAINIVAGTAKISGTIRCQKEDTREYILENLHKITNNICQAYGAECEIEIVRGLPVLVNDEKATLYAKQIAQELVGKENTHELEHPMMGAEDFTYFAQGFPASFLRLGSGNPEKGFTCQAHHPCFDFDEDAMLTGIKLLCALALNADRL